MSNFERQADDLTILVRRLCHQLSPDNRVRRLALDYLQRTGRAGSPLRDDEMVNPVDGSTFSVTSATKGAT